MHPCARSIPENGESSQGRPVISPGGMARREGRGADGGYRSAYRGSRIASDCNPSAKVGCTNSASTMARALAPGRTRAENGNRLAMPTVLPRISS